MQQCTIIFLIIPLHPKNIAGLREKVTHRDIDRSPWAEGWIACRDETIKLVQIASKWLHVWIVFDNLWKINIALSIIILRQCLRLLYYCVPFIFLKCYETWIVVKFAAIVTRMSRLQELEIWLARVGFGQLSRFGTPWHPKCHRSLWNLRGFYMILSRISHLWSTSQEKHFNYKQQKIMVGGFNFFIIFQPFGDSSMWRSNIWVFQTAYDGKKRFAGDDSARWWAQKRCDSLRRLFFWWLAGRNIIVVRHRRNFIK